MNDETNGVSGNGAANGAANGQQGAPSGGELAPNLHVVAQYVRDLSFENPNAPTSLQHQPGTDGQPDVNVGIDVKTREAGNNHYECMIHVRAAAKRGEMTLFIVELAYCGLVHLENVPAESRQPVLLIEVPRILFPFARQIVADVTRDGGFMPLLLDPIDFAALYRQQMAQQAQEQQGGTLAPEGGTA